MSFIIFNNKKSNRKNCNKFFAVSQDKKTLEAIKSLELNKKTESPGTMGARRWPGNECLIIYVQWKLWIGARSRRINEGEVGGDVHRFLPRNSFLCLSCLGIVRAWAEWLQSGFVVRPLYTVSCCVYVYKRNSKCSEISIASSGIQAWYKFYSVNYTILANQTDPTCSRPSRPN